MKKIILFLFLSLFSLSGFSQNYPIKTFFKEDSVVIMTIHQFEGLDLLLKNQIEKSIKHKNIIDSLQKTIADRNKIINTYSQINDSLLGLNIQKSLTIDSLKKGRETSETWFLERAIDNAWIYYDWTDSTVKCLDLTMYGFHGNRRNGKITFSRRPGANLVPDIEYWKRENRENPEIPQADWINYYRKKKITLLNYPNKLITPYKPIRVVIIKP